jgi:antitoxin (DNA-binding transcriptional repressor) of toxin-antitoxin stability system
MLLNGEEVAITKHGKIVALLVQQAKREPKRALDFKRRFSGAAKSDLPKTDIIGMLLEEREESP